MAIKIEKAAGVLRAHGSATLFSTSNTDFPLPDNYDKSSSNNLKIAVDGANVKVYINSTYITEFDFNALLTRFYKSIGLNSYDTKAVYSNIKYIPIKREDITSEWYGNSAYCTVLPFMKIKSSTARICRCCANS